MQLNYVKQVPPGSPPHTLTYTVEGDKLTVTHRAGSAETVDVFDFAGTPDGILDVDSIQTDLPVQPILSAERVNGALTVTVLDWSRS